MRSQSAVGAPNLSWGEGNYFVPAGSLGFSVAVFVICAVICILTLIIRRKVVGGELGGSDTGRAGSAALLVSLWLFYIIMSILQAYGILGEISMGIQTGVYNPNCECNTKPSAYNLCIAAQKAVGN